MEQTNAIQERVSQVGKTLYTAKTHTTGGRDGSSKSSDGILEVQLATPGSQKKGTNPEQLFASGWSACFMGAMGIASRKMQVAFPKDAAVDAEVDLVMTEEEYSLRARLNINLPGIERNTAREIIEAAHRTCPYSKATAGNVDVQLNLI